MSRTEREYIEEALENLEVLQSHLQRGTVDDPLIVDAVCMRLSAAIEALSHLPEDRRSGLFGEEWPAMWSTRNRIAHAYLDVNLTIIAATIERDLPSLVATLRQSIASDER